MVLTCAFLFVLSGLLPVHANTLKYEIIFNVKEVIPRPGEDSFPLGFDYMPSIGDTFFAHFSVNSNSLEVPPLVGNRRPVTPLSFNTEIAGRVWDISQGSTFNGVLFAKIENNQIIDINGSLRTSIDNFGYDFVDFNASSRSGSFSAYSVGTRTNGSALLRPVPLPGAMALFMVGLGVFCLIKSKIQPTICY